MNDEVEVRIDVTVTDENITDLLDAAMGTWEWWDDFHQDGEWIDVLTLDPDTGEAGLKKRLSRRSLKVSLAKHAAEEGYLEPARGGLAVDLGEYDSFIADEFLQEVVFGEVVYG